MFVDDVITSQDLFPHYPPEAFFVLLDKGHEKRSMEATPPTHPPTHPTQCNAKHHNPPTHPPTHHPTDDASYLKTHTAEELAAKKKAEKELKENKQKIKGMTETTMGAFGDVFPDFGGGGWGAP